MKFCHSIQVEVERKDLLDQYSTDQGDPVGRTEPAPRKHQARDDRYSELRSDATLKLPKIEMSYIGG